MRNLEQIFDELLEAYNRGESIDELITEFRMSLGFTPTQFASKLEVALQSVNRWEKNESKPRLNQLSKMKELVGLRSKPIAAHPTWSPSDTLGKIVSDMAICHTVRIFDLLNRGEHDMLQGEIDKALRLLSHHKNLLESFHIKSTS